MKNLKRNAVIITVLVFVCAAVYLNWSYNNKWGTSDEDLAAAEDNAMGGSDTEEVGAADENDEISAADTVSDYFAEARLTRQQSRDEALALLQSAAAAEAASQETIDSAMNTIAAMATYSMQETQIENLLVAKEFDDCVVFISGDGITVAVPAPLEGLSEASVARVTDTITTETEYAATQIKIIEVKNE